MTCVALLQRIGLALLAMLALPCKAQTTHVYLDLSGPWMRIDANQPPHPYRLPRTTLVTDGPFRLEREIQLPADGLTGLAILMTPLGGSFEMTVNGQSIGGLKPSRPWLAPPTHSIVLTVPDGLLHAGSNTLALEVGAIRVIDRLATGVPPASPLLGGAVELRAIAEGGERAHQLQRIYMPVDTVAQLVFCAVLIWLSRGSRYRKAMLWMAFYFGAVVVGFDLLVSLDIFAGFSRTPRDWLAPLNVFVWNAAPTETSLALLEWAPPVWLRILYYTMPWWGWRPTPFVIAVVNLFLLGLAIRRRNRVAAAFQWLMIGYNLTTVAILPPFSVPQLIPIGPMAIHIIPGYRIFIGLGLILILIRQSVRDRNERERLASEVAAARTVQQLIIAGDVEGVEAVYHPADELGGDFYQVLPLNDGGLLVAVGDVSGKGLKAAMVVSMVVGVLRSHKHLAPAALLSQINRTLAGSLDGGFVTCIAARIDAGGRCVLANAGHLEPYADGREIALSCGLPLGVASDAEYSETEVHASSLTFVSDGVVEAANAQRELFGFDRTRSISVKPACEIAKAASAWGQNDDITVVTVRRAV
ncbi:MAG TPA: PP2C family protein-serine/threonine phosphatase [Bryobacteraceae bacterium]|nr:PP2C family protein-serine/threonine phosphatase [Bryobacteraceae bacterium]